MPELTWVGKNKVITHHLDVPFRSLDCVYTFTPDGETSSGEAASNMVIHGDNLEALKALLPRYEGRVDCIYIDPPYNTGNEKWVYNDAVNDPRMKRWIGEVVGKEGDDLSRHDKWLCMMYPRLRLLHRLLSPSGVIFLSIDDNEQANLKAVCDEIFGSRNHMATFVWESSGNTDNQAEVIKTHEYIHAYYKNKNLAKINPVVDPNVGEDSKVRRDFAENSVIKNGAKNPPSVVTLPVGFPCEVDSLDLPAHSFANDFIEEAKVKGYLTRQMKKDYAVEYPIRLDDLTVRDGRLVAPCRVFSGWSSARKLRAFLSAGCVSLREKDADLFYYLTKNGVIYYRREGRQSHYVQSVLRNMGTTEKSRYYLEQIGINFEYPKPVELVAYLISLYAPKDGLVLDSFAGTGTTAHAVIDLNGRDEGTRRFILVELGDYADSVTARRVKNAIVQSSSECSFSFYELGESIFVEGGVNPRIPIDEVREYIWFSETGENYDSRNKELHPDFLGKTEAGVAYFYAVDGGVGSVLDKRYLSSVPAACEAAAYVFYAGTCLLSDKELSDLSITFKKIPRDIKYV